MTDSPRSPAHEVVERIWRLECSRVIGRLTRMLGDLTVAEEVAQDAVVAALERWPQSGIPERPGAWLMTTAKHRAIDLLRRRQRLERKHETMAHPIVAVPDEALDALEDEVGDDVLRLMFMTCHPILSPEARVALTLRLLGGLTTAEIARAFVTPETTVAQRIVRARRTLATSRVRFEVPPRDERNARLASVLEAIYLIFNEGYAATSGDDWMRPVLCDDALRLGRVLSELMADEAEAHALLALMEIQASRTAARVGADGQPVLLLAQDRSRWDHAAIRRGLDALDRVEALGGTNGLYALQAALAACHARAARAEETDWPRIVALYERLATHYPSPIVALNHAVAVSMATGPAAALPLVDALRNEAALQNYPLLPSVRGDLLSRLGKHQEAAAEFTHASTLTRNLSEKRLLRDRATEAAKAAERAEDQQTRTSNQR